MGCEHSTERGWRSQESVLGRIEAREEWRTGQVIVLPLDAFPPGLLALLVPTAGQRGHFCHDDTSETVESWAKTGRRIELSEGKSTWTRSEMT